MQTKGNDIFQFENWLKIQQTDSFQALTGVSLQMQARTPVEPIQSRDEHLPAHQRTVTVIRESSADQYLGSETLDHQSPK
jgi:hypothetical protein